MTYMSATFRLPDGKIVGVFAHYEDVLECIRRQSIDHIEEIVKKFPNSDYSVTDGYYLWVFDCIVVDFTKKRMLLTAEAPFGVQYLKEQFPDYEVTEIDPVEWLEDYVNKFFGGE